MKPNEAAPEFSVNEMERDILEGSGARSESLANEDYTQNGEEFLSGESFQWYQTETFSTFAHDYFLSPLTSPEEAEGVVSQFVSSFHDEGEELKDAQQEADMDVQQHEAQVVLAEGGENPLQWIREFAGYEQDEDDAQDEGKTHPAGYLDRLMSIIAEKMANQRARRVLVESLMAMSLMQAVPAQARGNENILGQVMQQGIQSVGGMVGNEVRNAITSPVIEQTQKESVGIQYQNAVQRENDRYAQEVQSIQNRFETTDPGQYSRNEQDRMKFENSASADATEIAWRNIDPDIKVMKEPEWSNKIEIAKSTGDVQLLMGVKADIAREKAEIIAQYGKGGLEQGSGKVADYNRQDLYQDSAEGSVERALQAAQHNHERNLSNLATRAGYGYKNAEDQSERRSMGIQRGNAQRLGGAANSAINHIFRGVVR